MPSLKNVLSVAKLAHKYFDACGIYRTSKLWFTWKYDEYPDQWVVYMMFIDGDNIQLFMVTQDDFEKKVATVEGEQKYFAFMNFVNGYETKKPAKPRSTIEVLFPDPGFSPIKMDFLNEQND